MKFESNDQRSWMRQLTKREMLDLEQKIEAAKSGPDALEEAIVGFFEIALWELLGKSWKECDHVNPTDFAIPKEQWSQICQWLIEADQKDRANPDSRIGVTLQWMNIGPSSFEVSELVS